MNQFAKRVIVALALCLVVVQTVAIAQNLGAAPQVNVAVQGQTGAQFVGGKRAHGHEKTFACFSQQNGCSFRSHP